MQRFPQIWRASEAQSVDNEQFLLGMAYSVVLRKQLRDPRGCKFDVRCNKKCASVHTPSEA
ncbi:hypothetical protein PCAR4_390008 [Paraburkholderia caribensis]|nr:hypothetical protein PCAR4_390008 [Paraburkholderia caribensis]